MSTPSETEQSRARSAAYDGRLEWQSELDASLAEIDSRLRHPRRRASDTGDQPMLPQLGQVGVTSELLDEIAWRVAEQIRKTQPQSAQPVPEPPPQPAQVPSGISVTIRVRKPLFRWFWRRRTRQSLISFADYRIT